MKPRRPAVKDSIRLRPEWARRKAEQVAAKAARKADAKRRKEAAQEANQASATMSEATTRD